MGGELFHEDLETETLKRRVGSQSEWIDILEDFVEKNEQTRTDLAKNANKAKSKILQAKNLRPTRDIISLLQALTGSPYTAARALQQLATKDERREFRPDGLCYALGTLEPKQLLTDHPPTVGRIVHTLLTAGSRLSQRKLADRADVSTRTIRNYRDRLEALTLIRVDETGYRLALSSQTATERYDPVVPTVLEESQTLLDAADALLETILTRERYGDPDDPLRSVLFWPPAPSRLLEQPMVSQWMRLAAALTATESIEDDWAVQMGSPLEQQPLSRETPSHLDRRSISALPPRLANQRRPIYWTRCWLNRQSCDRYQSAMWR